MRNQSERESIIQYTNHLIEQNNDEIKSLKSRLDKIISNDEQRKILENIEELNQYNRRLTLRLEEPMLSMIIEYKELLQREEKQLRRSSVSIILNYHTRNIRKC